MSLIKNIIFENDIVYRVTQDDESEFRMQEPVGPLNKAVVERIGTTDNVEDVEYIFVINEDGSGDYVEQSRTLRNDPLPVPMPTVEERLRILEDLELARMGL